MGLRNFVLRRIGQLIVTYFIFLTVLFVLFRLMPGDPAAWMILEGATDRYLERRAELGLDDPLHIQYISYLQSLVSLELGDSVIYRRPVSEIIWDKVFNTLFLMGSALILAYSIGITGGALMGWWRGGRTEKTGIVTVLIFRSSPEFWIGIVLITVFVFWLGWFPAAGMRTVGAEVSDGIWAFLNWDFFRHLFLPMLTGALYFMATPALLMRNTMLDVLAEDYIEIKKAEGLPERRILYRHAARNSILPVVTVVAIVTGAAMGGAVVIETVFSWDGMGRAMVQSVYRRDYPLAIAMFFIMGSLVIFMNFVADIAYVYLDPRVEYD